MAYLNLSNPGDITSVYSSVIENKNNWLLLHYEDDSDNDLGLHSFGNEGLEELKNKISDPDKVYIAFYREEYDDEQDPGYIIINYIPPSMSSIKRARVLVHSRRLGTIFKKHQTIFSIDSLSLLTAPNVRQAILSPDTPVNPTSPINTTTHSTEALEEQSRDLPAIPDTLDEPPSPTMPVKFPLYENPMFGRSHTPPGNQGIRSPKGFLAGLLKRKKKTKSAEYTLESPPPPIPPKLPPCPPKDKGSFDAQPAFHSPPIPQRSKMSQDNRAVRHRRSRSMSDFGTVSQLEYPDDHPVVESEPFQSYMRPLKGKWAAEPPFPSDPAERAQRRRDLQLKREQEEREAKEEEVRRQQRIKREKEDLVRQEAEEERRRKQEVEIEIRRMREERRRREEMEREEEEKKRLELEERKRQNRDRRLEEHRRLEQWRVDQARKAEAAARQAEEAKRREELERKKRIQEAAIKLKEAKKESDLTGWITMLSEDSLAWKRRYYKFFGSTIFLYRDKKDLTTPLEQVDLHGSLKGLKEWNEGYEDLEAIAFSFVVEFNDSREFWSMYADAEEEKFKILGLFKVAGGL